MSLPQLRLLPRLAQRMEDMGKGFVNDTSDISEPTGTSDPDAGCWDSYDANAPKGQRKKFKSKASPSKQKGAETIIEQEPNLNKSEQQQQSSPMKSSSARDVYSLLEQKLSNVWKPYEAESIDFWATARQNSHPLPLLEGDSSVTSKQAGEKSLIDLLRDEGGDNQMVEEEIKEEKNKEQELVSTNTLDRHSVGCPNENASFVTLRQIYPNKEVCGLWDLYVKCNADIDWAIDILLKEDELAVLRGDSEMQSLNNDMDTFVCSCNDPPPVQEHIEEQVSNYPEASQQVSDKNNDTMEIKLPQRPQRSRFVRPNQLSDPNLLEVKENIENCFVLGDDHYSKHLLKIRNFRSGGATTSSVRTTEDSVDNADEQMENINDADDNDNDDDDDDVGGLGNSETIGDDMMEMSLGEHLVQQLLENFRNESSLEGQIPHSLPLNLKVFMPRSLAKQLYMLWIESAYNHLEEERQKMVREDEEFARLLKHPKYSEYKQSPTNIREMLDIEYAWNLYKRDQEELDQQRSEMEKLSQPTDLATHLTQMKLCETFPDIPRETLLDILTTTDNNYNETVSILRSTMNDVEPIADHRNEDEVGVNYVILIFKEIKEVNLVIT